MRRAWRGPRTPAPRRTRRPARVRSRTSRGTARAGGTRRARRRGRRGCCGRRRGGVRAAAGERAPPPADRDGALGACAAAMQAPRRRRAALAGGGGAAHVPFAEAAGQAGRDHASAVQVAEQPQRQLRPRAGGQLCDRAGRGRVRGGVGAHGRGCGRPRSKGSEAPATPPRTSSASHDASSSRPKPVQPQTKVTGTRCGTVRERVSRAACRMQLSPARRTSSSARMASRL